MPRDWNAHYADPHYSVPGPHPLLAWLAGTLAPGRALDLASGPGRHAIHLARLGWHVTAVDSAPSAIRRLRAAAPEVDARLADLARGEFIIAPYSFDLICDFFYLQRDLFPAIRKGLRPGGTFAGAIHLLEPGHNPAYSMASGELREEFAGWKILYYSESAEPGRSRRSARIVARSE